MRTRGRARASGWIERHRTLLGAVAIAVGLLAAPGCKNRPGKNGLGLIVPPKNAEDWESRYSVAFDDGYTRTALNLEGRAPNDVTDQRLFEARLGHANLVILGTVEQVWGRGRYQGRQDQYVELQIDRELLGELEDKAAETQLIKVVASEDLPPDMRGQQVILFLRWAPGANPEYHHHLMPADDAVVSLIDAKVEHAIAEGVLDKDRSPAKGGAGGGGKKKKGKARREEKKAAKKARRDRRSNDDQG